MQIPRRLQRRPPVRGQGGVPGRLKLAMGVQGRACGSVREFPGSFRWRPWRLRRAGPPGEPLMRRLKELLPAWPWRGLRRLECCWSGYTPPPRVRTARPGRAESNRVALREAPEGEGRPGRGEGADPGLPAPPGFSGKPPAARKNLTVSLRSRLRPARNGLRPELRYGSRKSLQVKALRRMYHACPVAARIMKRKSRESPLAWALLITRRGARGPRAQSRGQAGACRAASAAGMPRADRARRLACSSLLQRALQGMLQPPAARPARHAHAPPQPALARDIRIAAAGRRQGARKA
jgi:hypothetical protein